MSGREASTTIIPGKYALSVGDPAIRLPVGWSWALLTDIAALGTGHTPSRKHPEYWGDDVPWLGIRDAGAHHGRIINATTQNITYLGLANSSARLLPKGTVCLSRTASVGYVVKMGRDMATSQDFVTWSCGEALDPDYLMQALIAEGEDIRRFGEGSTHTTIYFPEVKAFHLALPPLPEQRRIVAKIDSLTGKSKRAREHLDHIPRLVEKYKQAVLAAAFRGNLTREWRFQNRDATITMPELERRRRLAWEKHKKQGRYVAADGIDWHPAIKLPDNWVWASVDQLSYATQYGSSAKTSEDSSGIPVLRMGNIQDGRLDLTSLKYLPSDHSEFPELLLETGDVLFNRTNSPELVGKTAVFDMPSHSASFASYLIRIRVVGIRPQLLSYYINSLFGREWVASVVNQQVGQANVNGSKLKQLGVPVMPDAEQSRLQDIIEGAFAWIDRLATETTSARRLVDHLDQAILAKAFRGELVPQDPADEPASVLLERIRAERVATPKAKRGRKAVS